MDARQLCIRCFVDVDAGGYSNLVFKSKTAKSGLNARDLAFAAAVFYGTLEREITLDFLLDPLLKKGVAGLDPEVRAILRAGLYQCLYLDSVPVSAAVNESVRLCKSLKKSSASGLVNAVLRKGAGAGLGALDEIKDERTHLSVQYALCPGLVDMLCEQFGADAPSVMAAMLTRPAVAARVNTLRTDREALLARLTQENIQAKAVPLDNAIVFAGGDYLASSALADGSMRIQSLAAQGAAIALDAAPGMSMLDLCAAPGGKTLTAAQQMRNQGSIVAIDKYDSRLKLIEAQAALEGVTIVQTLCADGVDYKLRTTFDRVLCDVPCSGYGEIASKPELRRKPPRADNPLFALQRGLLEQGAVLLADGGRLVYSTCTLDRRENQDIVQGFLTAHPDFRLVPVVLDGLPAPRDGYVQVLPRTGEPEGFFIAVLER